MIRILNQYSPVDMNLPKSIRKEDLSAFLCLTHMSIRCPTTLSVNFQGKSYVFFYVLQNAELVVSASRRWMVTINDKQCSDFEAVLGLGTHKNKNIPKESTKAGGCDYSTTTQATELLKKEQMPGCNIQEKYML